MMRLVKRTISQAAMNEPRSRRLTLIRWLYLGAIAALALWLGNFLFGERLYLRSEGLVLGDSAIVATEFPVMVRDILVQEGEAVSAGEAAVIVSSQTVAETLARLSAGIAAQVVRQGELRIRVEVIDAMMPFAENRQTFASSARRELESLLDRGYLRLNEQTAALENEYRGVQDLKAFKAERRAVESELETLGPALAEAQSAITELRRLYDNGRLAVPIDGVVTRVLANKGSVVPAGEPLIELTENRRYVLAYVPTDALYKIEEGDAVMVKAGLRAARGIVTRVEPFAAPLPREFQRTFAPIERQQVIRVEFLPGEMSPPLLSKVSVSHASLLPDWVMRIARSWSSRDLARLGPTAGGEHD